MPDEHDYRDTIDETARRRFEAAWRSGQPQPIDAFLPAANDPRFPATLRELVCIDLEFGWKKWKTRDVDATVVNPPQVEEYLSRFPQLRDTEHLIALLREEVRLRADAGDVPSPQELRRRFPDVEQTVLGLRDHSIRGQVGNARGAEIPGYEILETIGRGGMGIIFKARQVGLKRIVALKRILSGAHASTEELERFRREAEAVAQLQHPNIVQVYEIGEQDGQPFFSLEYVDGGTLADFTKGQPQPSMQAAKFIITLARAVECAHQRGILHRDLKPSNILLQKDEGGRMKDETNEVISDSSFILHPSSFRPKITDFGLAKQLGSDDGGTATGDILGTPSYMAPEQATGNTRAIGPATDVYALGAILYELLTGRPPYRGESPIDTVEQVCRGDVIPPGRLVPKLPRDIETICLKCLAKEPVKRYLRAADLADDLERFTDGKPILARRTGPWGQGVKWVRRRPALAAFLASTAVGLIALAILSVLWSNARFQSALDRERLNKAEAEFQSEQARQAQEHQVLAEAQERETRGSLYTAHMLLAHQAWQNENVERVLELLETHRPEDGHEDLRGFEWYRLWQLCHNERLILRGHTGNVEEVAFSPDGRLLAAGGGDYTVKIWDVATGEEKATLRGHSGAVVTLSFAPDGKTLATGSGDRTIRLWDIETSAELATLEGHTCEIYSVAFSPDGKTLASGAGVLQLENKYGELKLWDVSTREEARSFSGHQGAVSSVAFIGDGSTLASGSWDGSVRLWRVADGSEIETFTGNYGQIYSVAVSADGRTLAAGDNRGSVFIWDLQSRKVKHTFAAHAARVSQLSFVGNGSMLATASRDRTVKLWNVETGKPAGTIVGHVGQLQTLAVAADGRSIATGGYDKVVKIWELPTTEERDTLRGHTGSVGAVNFSPDGKWLASAGQDRVIRLWNVATGKMETAFPAGKRLGEDGHAALIARLAFSPDCQTLATAAADGKVKLWEFRTGNLLATLTAGEFPIFGLAFHPSTNSLATGDFKGVLKLWDLGTHEARMTTQAHSECVLSMAYAPTGELLASVGSEPFGIKLWNGTTVQELVTISENLMTASSVAFHPKAPFVVAGTGEGTVLFFDRDFHELRHTLRGHTGGVYSMAFTPDGKRLAVGSGDGALKIWDLNAWQEVATISAHRGRVTSVAFSPDGKTLASSSVDGTVRLWRWRLVT